MYDMNSIIIFVQHYIVYKFCLYACIFYLRNECCGYRHQVVNFFRVVYVHSTWKSATKYLQKVSARSKLGCVVWKYIIKCKNNKRLVKLTRQQNNSLNAIWNINNLISWFILRDVCLVRKNSKVGSS